LHVGSGQQDGEFVAAQAKQHFVAPGQAGDFAGHAHQQGVAGGVAEVVVDGLEFVQIEVKQGGRGAMPPGFGQHAFQFDLEAMAVVEAGEGVALGQIEQLFGGLALAGDIFVDPQMADEAVIAVAHGVAQLGDDAAVTHDDLMAVGIALPGQNLGQMLSPEASGSPVRRCWRRRWCRHAGRSGQPVPVAARSG
jgi:hypothetical protein